MGAGSRAVFFVCLLFGLATGASANTLWTLNNVQFLLSGVGTNTVTGTFSVNTVTDTITAWNITVSGSNTQANATYSNTTVGDTVFFPVSTQIQFSSFDGIHSLELVFALPIDSSTGTVLLVGGGGSSACPGCALLTSGYVTDGSLASTPEPSTSLLLAFGIGLIAIAVMRKNNARSS